MNKRIKQLRKALDLTQQEFADRIGVKRNTVATYEGGRNAPVDAVSSLICKEFCVNEEWLRHGTGKMFIEKTAFSLDDYANTNHLTSVEKEIVRGFMELAPDIRNAVYDIFKKAFEKDNSTYDNAPDDPQDLEKMFPPISGDDTNINTG